MSLKADYLSHLEATDEYFIQYGEERSKALIEAIDFHSAPVYYYTVFRKDTGVMTGYVGITPLREQKAGNLEFYIFREFRRNRYAHTVWRGTYCKNHRYFLKISEGNSNGYSKHKRV